MGQAASSERGWQRFVLPLLLGAAAALGQAPWGLFPLSISALVLLFGVALRTRGQWQSFRLGWLAGAGYFLVSLHWIVEPFLVDLPRHGWMAPFALLLMGFGAGLFWAAAFWLAHRLAGGHGRAGRLLVLAAALAGAEAVRALVLTGFPWALIGHIWVGTPLAQLAAFGGPHLLSLITTLLAAACLWAGPRLWLAVPGLALVAGWVWLEPGAAPATAAQAPVVRLVQPNAPQDQKWDPEYVPIFLRRMLEYTASGPQVDLVIWPETSVPWLLDSAGTTFSTMAQAARGAPLVFGIQRRDGQRYFNTMTVIDAAGLPLETYDKAHLVPFGEYMPLGELAARFGIHGLASSEGGGYSAGLGRAGGPQPGGLIALPGIGQALPMICYEGIFAEELHSEIRPRLLLLITNDAWFGRSAGPQQHFAQARLRAIEQGLPMIRVANTGISGMIDAQGRVIGTIALGTAGAADFALPPALAATIYTKSGDWPALMLIVLALLGGVFGLGRFRIDPSTDSA